MTVQMGNIPVLAMPMFDPGMGRVDLELPTGLTISEIVGLALPNIAPADMNHVRVVLVTPEGMTAVEVRYWHTVKPKAGVQVVIRIVPGKEVFRSVLQIVVGIAAIALGGLWGPALGGFLGIGAGLGSAIIGLGVNLLGNMLINALIPPPKPPAAEQKTNTYTISGWRNALTPDGVVPDVMGEIRFAPPFAAMSYTEIVNDIQYIRSVFLFGYGPLDLSSFRIGDTPLESYKDYQIEVRNGYASDQSLALYPQQVIEDGDAVDLTRPLPRDTAGNIIGGGGTETPVTRNTAADSESASAIFAFPAGLFTVNDDAKRRPLTVVIRIRMRHVTQEAWTLVTTLNITSSKREAFYRQHTWKLPYRGFWQLEFTRMTDERAGINDSDRSVLVAVQSIRPEYPLNFDKPLALVAIRIKATYQLNGSLDRFNGLAKRIGFDWDPAAPGWVWRTFRNPASAMRYALTGPANAFPSTEAELDFANLQAWHEMCTAKGLSYDAVHMEDTSLKEVLDQISAAGRAMPRHDGLRRGVVIDRPRDLPVIDHISPRNSEQFRWQRTYVDPPHAFRVPFNDRTNDYKPTERIVRWPGYLGDITLTEEYQLAGKTDPVEVFRETRRRMYEIIHRPDRYSCVMDGGIRTVTRGDLVMGSFDVLSRSQVAARVKSVLPFMIELDEQIAMEAGETYAVRFRRYIDDNDTIGVSVVRPVVNYVGVRNTVMFAEEGYLPVLSDVVHFGPMATESFPMVVSGIEAGDDFSSVLHLLDAAPQIDEIIDAEVVPVWSGRVGAEIDGDVVAPSRPVFSSIATGYSGTGEPGGLFVQLVQGTESPTAASVFAVDHRLFGAGTWTTVSFAAADGGRAIAGYNQAEDIQLRARSLAADGTPSPYTAIINIRIGSTDADIPGGLPTESIAVIGRLGFATLNFSVGNDGTDRVKIYRSTASSYDPETDAIGTPVTVEAGKSYSLIDGDASRTSVLINGTFDNGDGWSPINPGWSFEGGRATHVSGYPGQIQQAVAFDTSKFYRIGFRLLNMTSGNMQPSLTGGSTSFMYPQTANGYYVERIQPQAGNNQFSIGATIDNNGSIDDIVCFVETAACLAQGQVNYWLEPQNSDGVPGPVAGPFTVTIT